MFSKDITPHTPHTHEEEGKKKHGKITIPDQIGPYTIHETIGEGAFSIVKMAYHEEYKQNYACKIVPIRMINEKNLLLRFELELRISQIMRHPGVSITTDVLKDEYNYYIFMEYYPNGNLLNYIVHKTRLDEEEAKNLIYQIFDSVEFIHNQKVCHRDLKPENVLIDRNGELRISDFGLSNFVGEGNLVKTPCGSPCYVSPECISGSEYDGLKSDVWSCGVILYAMVTGMLPWTKRKMNQLFDQIRSGCFTIPKYVSQECADLIQKLMTVDPDRRITLENAKKHDWFYKQTSIGILPVSPSVPTMVAKSFQPNSPIIENAKSSFNGVPYLSIRKVDFYFRPDVDYNFHRVFKKISNIHAIENYHNPEKSLVSSPKLDFDKTLSELKKSSNINIKSRRKSYGIENKDPNSMIDSDSQDVKKLKRKICTSQMNLNTHQIYRKVNENVNNDRNNELFRNPLFSLSIENLKNPSKDIPLLRKRKNYRRRTSKKPESFSMLQ